MGLARFDLPASVYPQGIFTAPPARSTGPGEIRVGLLPVSSLRAAGSQA